MTRDMATTAELYVDVTHNPLAFFYEMFTPTVKINGEAHHRPWGMHKFELSPGSYEVSVSYPWLFAPECGKNTARIEIQAGQSKTVTYCAGLIRFLPGKIAVS